MNNLLMKKNLRVLVIDDNRAIHEDFRKILCPSTSGGSALADAEAMLFDAAVNPAASPILFEIDSAYQGAEGLAMVEEAARQGRPYAMAFVDVRMPPGWDGLETTARLWAVCPDLQIVICTAYSDYSWDEMASRLHNSDQLLILKKPFDSVEVLQLANSLTEKWRLHQQVKFKVEELEREVQERTSVLKAANESLREQAMLLDLAHEAIFVRDMSGRIQFWNKGAERLYGLTAVEAAGKTTAEIFPHDFTGALREAEKILLETGEWSGELRNQGKTGQEVVVDSRWTLMRNAQGQPQSVLVINADVTEKKKLEAQFLRSQRMEGIGTLATGMAHDLNNILAPILMSAGVLRWETTPEDKELAISRIESSVQRGAEIIQQVLTFGRGVSGERVAVNPGDLIKELSKICTQTFPKDVVVTAEANAGGWPIIGDKTQLHQVLLNLSINARDAMPHGGKLSMRAENFMVDELYANQHAPMQAGPYVRLDISDTGEGIPKTNLEKIFEPFFTTKEFGKGTGLGLSTVLGIVKSHHGSVTVESELNRGTTFTVLLPASIAIAKKSTPGPPAGLPHGNGELILVVDDEVNIVTATRRMLEQHGYHVLVADRGRAALQIFTKNERPIDLVVTDIMMPGMDGIELIQALRGINPRVKVIASSGLGRDLAGGLRGKELEALGIKTFLTKPYTAEKLLTALQGLLGAKPAAADANSESTLELTHG